MAKKKITNLLGRQVPLMMAKKKITNIRWPNLFDFQKQGIIRTGPFREAVYIGKPWKIGESPNYGPEKGRMRKGGLLWTGRYKKRRRY